MWFSWVFGQFVANVIKGFFAGYEVFCGSEKGFFVVFNGYMVIQPPLDILFFENMSG